MKKMTLFLAILILSRVGIAYGADTAPNGLQNFFLGSSNANTANINQVLALLVGPAGPPGAAGVAGRDGFSGLNGVDGMPGAPGPVGQTGPQGIQGIQGLQGVAGAPGPAGAQGLQGLQGPAGGASLGYANGTVGLTGCDDSVKLDIGSLFTPSGFKLKSISVSGISTDCIAPAKLNIYITKFPCEPAPAGGYAPGKACTNVPGKVTMKCVTPIENNVEGVITIDAETVGPGGGSTCSKYLGTGDIDNFFVNSDGSGGTSMNDLYRTPKTGYPATDNPAIGLEIVA
jgi:hypothetical protein